jgi:DNA polymerase-3 subunit epsilon
MRFAIVDIETTGGSPAGHRIVELAVVLVKDGQIVDQFVSFCQPGMAIPLQVQLIHGISDAMVADAPLFSELIPQLDALLEGSIFVAHSAAFDYGFIQAEYRRAGMAFSLPKLCTVKMGRRLEPGLRSYSLARLCQFFGIRNNQAHRALSDAMATAEIFIRYVQHPGFEQICREFLSRKNTEKHLPPHLEPGVLQKLPRTPGVYLFHDHKGKVLYVGKAGRIKDRVLQHFTGHTHTRDKSGFSEQIHGVSFVEAGHELMALLIENEQIKKHFPPYNSTLKEFRMGGGIFLYEDRQGYLRLVAGEAGKWSDPVKVFRSKGEAHLALLKFSMENGLCLKLNNFFGKEAAQCKYETEAGQKCRVCHENADNNTYNRMLRDSLEKWDAAHSLLLEMPGRQPGEIGLVYLENGKIKGFGFLDPNQTELSLSAIRLALQPYYDTFDSQTIIRPWLVKAKPKAVTPEGIALLSLV